MHLVEIFLPLADKSGNSFEDDRFAEVRTTLTERFGGVTAFTRAPAQGVFKDAGKEVHDDVVLIEVMTDALDREVWARYRKHLERTFGQDEILIRATAVEKL
jgi:hypothetical protein